MADNENPLVGILNQLNNLIVGLAEKQEEVTKELANREYDAPDAQAHLQLRILSQIMMTNQLLLMNMKAGIGRLL